MPSVFLHGIGRGYSLAEILGEKYVGGERVWSGIRGGTREVAYSGRIPSHSELTSSVTPDGKTARPTCIEYSHRGFRWASQQDSRPSMNPSADRQEILHNSTTGFRDRRHDLIKITLKFDSCTERGARERHSSKPT